jgi:thioredoxin-related protein
MKRSGIFIVIVVGLLAWALTACGPAKHLEDKMQWHAYKEIEGTFPRGPKPVFLYISEAGCENCENMKQYVYSRPEIAWFLNTNYFSVNLDIQADLPITMGGKLYDHAAFNELFTNRVPNYIFFDSTGEVKGLFQGDMNLLSFKQLLKYVHAGHFGTTLWEDYLKTKEAETDTVLGVF